MCQYARVYIFIRSLKCLSRLLIKVTSAAVIKWSIIYSCRLNVEPRLHYSFSVLFNNNNNDDRCSIYEANSQGYGETQTESFNQ